MSDGIARRRARATRHAQEAEGARRELIDHRFEQRDLVVERQRVGGSLPVRQPGAQAVVPHDPVSVCERLDELPEVCIPPVLDKVAHPPRRHHEQGPVANGGVGDPPAVELDERRLLFQPTPDYAAARAGTAFDWKSAGSIPVASIFSRSGAFSAGDSWSRCFRRIAVARREAEPRPVTSKTTRRRAACRHQDPSS